MDAPFDLGYAGTVSGRFAGVVVKTWDRAGWARCGGKPYLAAWPTDPPSGRIYLNHPPLSFWAARAVAAATTLNERALRVLPVLSCAVAAALCAGFAASRLSGRAGVVAALTFAALPMTTVYGAMAGYEAPAFALGVAAWLRLDADAPGRARLAACGVLLVLAAWIDWQGVFYAAGALLFFWIRSRRVPRLAVWRATAGAATVGALSYLALCAAWVGLDASVDTFRSLREASASASVDVGWRPSEFLAAQAGYARKLFGPTALLAGLLGVFAPALRCARRDPSVHAFIVASVAAATLNVGIFQTQAFTHPFWSFPFAAAATLGSAWVVELVRRAGAKAGVLATVVVVAGAAFSAAVAAREVRKADTVTERALAAAMNAVADDDTLLLMPVSVGAAAFYADAWVVPDLPPEDVPDVLRRFQAGAFTTSRVVTLTWTVVRRAQPAAYDAIVAAGATESETVALGVPLSVFTAVR